MSTKRMSYIVIICLVSICHFNLIAQKGSLRLNINVQDKMEHYRVGDTMKIFITASQQGASCPDGIEKIKLFTKGLKIDSKHPWQEVRPGVWSKELNLLVFGNKKGQLQLTAYRKTDKGTIVKSQNFKLTQ